MGKSLQEGYGEVQEMIDICDFAVGLVNYMDWTDSERQVVCMSNTTQWELLESSQRLIFQ
jgi:acyl-CoA reductase-like NAD-dependent aldehyde dehydrogenase